MRNGKISALLFLLVLSSCNAEPTSPVQTADTSANTVAAAAADATNSVAAVAAEATNTVANIAVDTASSNDITNSEKLTACKMAISKLMGKPTSIMTATITPDSYFRVTYKRPDDGKTFKNECRFDGNSIVWRGVDIFAPGEGPGRWRDNPADERITWSKVDGKINVEASY